MKILQLSYEIYPVVGGTSTLIQYLMEAMYNKDCEIHLITKTIDKNHPEVIKVANSYIHTIYCVDAEETNALIETRTQVKFLRKIKELMNGAINFDLIHVHDALPVDLVPFLRKEMKIPIIMSYHINHHILKEQAKMMHDSDQKKNEIAYGLEIKGADLCDYFMAASQATKQWLIESYAIQEDKIYVVPYGISLVNYPQEIECSEIRKNLGKESDVIILYVGRFVLQKGIEYLLEAFIKLVKEVQNVKLVLVGEGKYEKYIREKLSNNVSPDRFQILKKIPFYELPPYYRCADVVVMPSIFEPFGMVSIEGMASKGMMIISDIDGLSEIVKDGYNGYAIPVNESDGGIRSIDSDTLKKLIYKAIIHKEKSDEIRENAYNYVHEYYSANRFAEGICKVYNQIIERYKVENQEE